MLTIFNKEFKSYFTSATGYVFMTVFLLISGIFFALSNLLTTQPTPYYNNVLSSITFVFLILVPILTMRTISEETHQKTDQLLLTVPISLSDIVLGKYFAAVALFLLTLLITGLYPFMLSLFGAIAFWEILGGYIGFALFGSALIAIGVFISSLTESLVAAAVGTFGALLFIWVIDWVQQGLPTTLLSGVIFAILLLAILCSIIYFSTKNIYICAGTLAAGGIAVAAVYLAKKELFEGFTSRFFGWFSLLSRYDKFSMGMLDVSSIVYYITFSAALVFLTIRVIDKRRWS
jgi:hypothetical protein